MHEIWLTPRQREYLGLSTTSPPTSRQEAKALEGVCVCLFIYGDGIGGTGRTEPRSSEPYE